jgi:hypothetical protein
MAFDYPALIARIARYWAGQDNTITDIGRGAHSIVGRTGECYEVTLPGYNARLAEDSGQPFTRRVPARKLLVRCRTDAPDAWWYVNLDGTFTVSWGDGVLPDLEACDHGACVPDGTCPGDECCQCSEAA